MENYIFRKLFKFLKSIHICMPLLCFLTGTILDTHLECLTGKMIFALSNLLSSFLIWVSRLG
jgi:hypothetical protein